MTYANKRLSEAEILEQIEPLMDQAEPEHWFDKYGFRVWGYKGNPIIAAIHIWKKKAKDNLKRAEDSEMRLAFYESRYGESLLAAEKLLHKKH